MPLQVSTTQALPMNYELVNRFRDGGRPDNPLWWMFTNCNNFWAPGQMGPRNYPEIHKHLRLVSDWMKTLLSPQISTDYSMKYGQAIASDLLTPNLSFLWFLLSSLATKMCGLSQYCKNTVKYCNNIVPLLGWVKRHHLRHNKHRKASFQAW